MTRSELNEVCAVLGGFAALVVGMAAEHQLIYMAGSVLTLGGFIFAIVRTENEKRERAKLDARRWIRLQAAYIHHKAKSGHERIDQGTASKSLRQV